MSTPPMLTLNPVTSLGLHLRRGMLVLWADDRGSLRLVRIVEADSTDRRRTRANGVLTATLDLLNGTLVRAPIDHLVELPRHDPAYRRRRAFRFQHTARAATARHAHP